MLEMMVGSLSNQHKKQFPHYAALATSAFDLQLTERQKQSLQRQGLDLNALNVAREELSDFADKALSTRRVRNPVDYRGCSFDEC